MNRLDTVDRLTRRQALKTAATFMILPAGLARGYAANEKLNLGIIGLTGMGGVDAKTFNGLGENLSALCDVDSTILDKRGAEYPGAKKYTDFRKMIENEKLDGVIVAVPDHNHAYISVYAMRHGLNVYCQKPLCKSVHEARIMAAVAAETKVITQMGTQTSAEPRTLRTAEFIQSGAIGEITEIHMTTDRPIWPQGLDRVEGQDAVPSTLDWDLWLGTAASRPFQGTWPQGHPVYSPERKRQFAANGTLYHPFSWRGWLDFGSGALGDIAPHSMNVIFLTLDLGAPSAIEVIQTTGLKKEMYPDSCIIRFDWAARGIHPPLSVYWYDGNLPLPVEMQAQRPATAAGRRRRCAAARAAWSGSGRRAAIPRVADLLPARAWSRCRRLRSVCGAARKSTRTGPWRSKPANRRPAISATPAHSPKPTNWATLRSVWVIASNGTLWISASPTARRPTSTCAANIVRAGTSKKSPAAPGMYLPGAPDRDVAHEVHPDYPRPVVVRHRGAPPTLRGGAASGDIAQAGTRAARIAPVDLLSGLMWSPRTFILAGLAALGIFFLIYRLYLIAQDWRLRAVAEERARLAHDLHDTLAQSFAGIGFQLQAVRNSVPPNSTALERQVDLAMELARTSHEEVRRSIARLHPETPGPVGLLPALRTCAERMINDGRVKVETYCEDGMMTIPPRIKDTLIRIGQEAIANSIRHAGPSTIRIRVRHHRASICLSVEDDGAGFVADGERNGFGLVGMHRRAESISATLGG